MNLRYIQEKFGCGLWGGSIVCSVCPRSGVGVEGYCRVRGSGPRCGQVSGVRWSGWGRRPCRTACGAPGRGGAGRRRAQRSAGSTHLPTAGCRGGGQGVSWTPWGLGSNRPAWKQSWLDPNPPGGAGCQAGTKSLAKKRQNQFSSIFPEELREINYYDKKNLKAPFFTILNPCLQLFPLCKSCKSSRFCGWTYVSS